MVETGIEPGYGVQIGDIHARLGERTSRLDGDALRPAAGRREIAKYQDVHGGDPANAREEPLNVVIVYDFASINGGQAKVAIDSAIGLRRAGHNAIYFAAVGPVEPALVEAGVETRCLEQHDLVGHPSKTAAMVQGTWNSLAAERLGTVLADLPRGKTVVHVHGWAKALSPSIAAPIRQSGLPAVYTMHEYFQFCPNGGFYHYGRNEICRLKPLSAACWASRCDSRSYSRKLWRNARLSAATHLVGFPELFSDYITFSPFQSRIVAPFLPAHVHLHEVGNPVSAPDLGSRDAVGDDILFVGRISDEKGPLLFAEAARRAGVQPVFVGNGPLYERLERDYPEARLLGWRDADGVRAALRQARAMVFPSVWYEGQPLTVLEAKAAGVPIIVSDACAGRDDVENGTTGLWFKSGDIDDLARALVQMKDDARVAAMSRAAYEAYWRDPPTVEKHVGKLVDVYRLMLDRSQAS